MELELHPRLSCRQHENHPENTPSPAKVGSLQVDELAQLSRSADHADLTRDAKPHTRRLLTHLVGPPDMTLSSTLEPSKSLSLIAKMTAVFKQRIIHQFGGW